MEKNGWEYLETALLDNRKYTKIYRYNHKNEKEFTQMITFSVSDQEDSSNILDFIIAVSKVNPLYAVRILKQKQ